MYAKLKDVISDLIGLGILVAVSIMIYQGKMAFLWEGVAGYVVGGVFFFISDEGIANGLQKFVNKLANGKKEE